MYNDNDVYPLIDRRAAKRKMLKFTIRYKMTAQKEMLVSIATTVDISSKSVAFESADLIPIGSEMEAEILMPSMPKAIKVKGSINRIEEIERMKRYRYSIVFEEIEREEQHALERYIQLIDIDSLLRLAVRKNASDLHLVANRVPIFRIEGELIPLSSLPIPSEDLKEMILSTMTENQKVVFAKELELDFSYLIPEGNRFRVNVHLERGNLEAAFRVIPSEIKTVPELGLPSIVEDLAKRKRGLIIVTGPAGSGKTTTLTTMIDIINRERNCMIISIEDPIEYVHESKKSIIKQREIGVDTLSFESALKHVLRQDPNVILVGEMRDLDSIAMAISAAETGHLILTTLHTPDSIECINRIIDVYPPEQQHQVWSQLADCLEGIIAQLLLPKKYAGGRIVATEVLIITPAIKNLIRARKIEQIRGYIETGAEYGMHSMDSSLARLVKDNLIDRDLAIGFMKNPKVFKDI